jgi:hypothetical protein
MSFRNGWLKKTARSEPERSRTSISKILKRGRRVGRTPAVTISPTTEAATPGRREAIVWNVPRSS